MTDSGRSNQPSGVKRFVVTHPIRRREPTHDRETHAWIARALAGLIGGQYAGDYDPQATYASAPYYVPSDALVGRDVARQLHMHDQHDLFGGFVPQAFMASKAISHGLVGALARRPEGWSEDFTKATVATVLPGYSAFTLDDARRACQLLLKEGPIRWKPVRATAGRGQEVLRNQADIDRLIAQADRAEIEAHGIVIESHLDDVVTHSVGQVTVADLTISYHGTQRTVEDNRGETVYGGSRLLVVRGGFDALGSVELDQPARLAIEQSQQYDRAALDCFDGFFASRRNYDVAQGTDPAGKRCSGVLEQSWRIGGASSAEVAALMRFRESPETRAVWASSIEFFGESQQPPADATILFRGVDDDLGFMTKCVTVQDYGNQQQ